MVSCSGFGLPLHAQLLRLFVTLTTTGASHLRLTSFRNISALAGAYSYTQSLVECTAPRGAQESPGSHVYVLRILCTAPLQRHVMVQGTQAKLHGAAHILDKSLGSYYF